MASVKEPHMRFRYKGKIFQWKTDIVKLTIDELLFLEYRIESSKNFNKMFVKKMQGVCCQICSTNAMAGKASLDAHIIGKKHQRAVELVVEYRHKTIKSLSEEETAKKAPQATVATPAKVTPVTKPGTVAKPAPSTPAAAGTPKPAAKPAGAQTPAAATKAAVALKPTLATPAAKPAANTKVGTPATAKATLGATPQAAKTSVAAMKSTTPVVKKAETGSPAAKLGGGATTPAQKPAITVAAKPAAVTTPAKKAVNVAAKPVGGALGTAKPVNPASTPTAKPAVKAADAPSTPVPKPAAGTTIAAVKSVGMTPKPAVAAKVAQASASKPSSQATTAVKPAASAATATDNPISQIKNEPIAPNSATESKIITATVSTSPAPKTSTTNTTLSAKPTSVNATSGLKATANATTPLKATTVAKVTSKPVVKAGTAVKTPVSGALAAKSPATPKIATAQSTTKTTSIDKTDGKKISLDSTAQQGEKVESNIQSRATPPPPDIFPKKSAAPSTDMVAVNATDIETVDLLSDSEEQDSPNKVAGSSQSQTAPKTSESKDSYGAGVIETPEIDTQNSKINHSTFVQIRTLRTAIPSFNLTDLKQVEFRLVNLDWTKMISEAGGYFKCNMCNQGGFKGFSALQEHLDVESHKAKFEQIKALYHPVFCPIKLPTKFVLQGERAGALVDLKAKERELSKENVKVASEMSLEEFKMKHIFLDVSELLKVEFREKSNIWFCLIYKQGPAYKCGLCKTPYMGNVKNIVEHLHGRRHLNSANAVQEMHHPKFCIAKSRGTPTAKDGQGSDSNKQKPQTPTGKENMVLNPLAVVKSTPQVADSPAKEASKTIPVVARKSSHTSATPVSQQKTPLGKRSAPTSHPGLQPQNKQAKGQSFSVKTFNAKPETVENIEGYVGVEYVVKILRTAMDPSPRFECCLCEIESDGNGMQAHLKSLQHRLKYLDRHFRACMREFESFRNDPTCKNVLAEIARRVAVAVEKHHGRDLPFECLQEEYRINRPEIMAKVFSFRHASEYSGPSMVHVIDKMTLNDMLQNRDAFDNVQQDPKRRMAFDNNDEMASKRHRMDDNGQYLDVDEHRRLVDQFLRSTNVDRRRRSRSHGRARGRSRDRWMEQGRQRRTRSRSMGRKRSRSGDVWSSYKRMFDLAIRDLDTDYKRFERDPETHPLYQKEWKIFWQKRSEELANDGRNPATYDFQPEWILFWTRRMDQIYEEEVDNLKKKLRDRLNLPYHNHELRETRYHIGHQRQPTSAFSQIRQNMDNMGPGGPNMGPVDPNMMDVDRPRMGGPDGPHMGRPGPQRMGGPGGPHMGGLGGPHMSGPHGPQISGLHMGGNNHPMGPGGDNMGAFNVNQMNQMQPNTGPFNMLQQNMGSFNMPQQQQSHFNTPNLFDTPQQNMMGPQFGNQGGMVRPNLTDIPKNVPVQGVDNRGPVGAQIQRNIRPLMPDLGSNRPHPITIAIQQPQQRPIVQRENVGDQGRRREHSPPKEAVATSFTRNLRSIPQAGPERRDEERRNEVRRNETNVEKRVDSRKDAQRSNNASVDDKPIETGPLTVVSVLRLLTALEDHLGILGPRVVDLMSKALTYEKAKLGSADKALLTHENTVFLETVREKLRGQIVVGVLDASKTRAVNKAIKDVTELLNKNIPEEPAPVIIERVEVSKQPTPAVQANVAKPSPQPLLRASPSPRTNEAEEKRELAAKLAAALSAQGKTNVSSEQLEQLIAVYSLIEKKQKENASEPKKQNLSDLLVDSLRGVSSSGATRSSNYNENRNDSPFDNMRGQQQQMNSSNNMYSSSSMNTNTFNRNSDRQFQSMGSSSGSQLNNFGQSQSSVPSFMRTSFSLSNFDTSLTLPSLPPLTFGRNQDSNRQQQESNIEGSSQNSPAYMTNMGRGGTGGSGSSNKQDMVSYPSIWQRGSIGGNTSSSGRNQQTPMGWQQNNSNRNIGGGGNSRSSSWNASRGGNR